MIRMMIFLALVQTLSPAETAVPPVGRGRCIEGLCADEKGVYLYDDGSRYEGGFSGGIRNGSGIMHYPDGSLFSGQWKEGRRSGMGLSLLADGAEFEGPFSDDRPSGTGLFTFSDGRVVRAHYAAGKLVRAEPVPFEKTRDGMRFGPVLAQGGSYTGWYRGRRAEGFIPHGRGRIKWNDGCAYSGQWVEGKMHGRGIMTWEDGSSYAGQWESGRRSGWGLYTWKSGSRYMGRWKDNRKDGPGAAFYADGTMQKGLFRDDRFLGLPAR